LPPVTASPIAAPTLPAPRTDATGTAAATAEAGGGRITPIPADEVGHLLVRLAATAGLPELIVVHGRAGLRPAELPPVPVPGRFLARIRVHYPGTELVADATLTPRTDPYLADYQIDGRATLPAVIGLEAMAQAAGALAGQPLRRAADVRLSAPVAAQADMTMAIRICALHHGDAVETVLRCAGSGYRIDHMRAVFPIPAGDAHQRGADDAQGSEDRDASGGGAQPAGPRPGGGPPAGGTATGIVDGTELYGSLCPHSGRFRRVAFLTELTSHSCRALIRGTDEAPWFGADLASGLLLGSPGINDAAIHVLQASVPQRRLTLAGCESVAAHGPAVTGAVQVRARERRTDGPGYVWDVDAVDGNGTLVVSWTGVRLTEAGPLHRTEPWPPALLAVYLERGAAALGLGPALRVTIHTEEVTAGEVNAGEAAAADAAANGHRAEAGHGDRTSQQAGIDQASRSHLDGLTLTVETAAGRAACAWVPADSGHDTALARAPVWGELREQLRDRLGEPDEIAAARLRTALDCLSKARLPADCAPVISHGAGDGWVLFRTAGAAVASTVVPVIGMTAPVVVAIMAAIAGGETCDPDARDQ
jgi:enediyne polyketide synthase